MRLYGTLSELVAAVFRKGGKEVKIEPASQSGSGPIVITIPDVGSNAANLVTTGDTGTVTSTMIANGTIVDGDISASAAIADTKLATISTAGKVANSATTATNSNTPSTIVARDGSGDFSAGTITASLTGNVTGNVSGSAASFTGSLSGEVTGTQSATVVADDVIDNANIKSNAGIVDTKLATISTAGKVSGSAITSGTIGGTTSVNTTGSVSANTLTSSSTTTAMQVYINGTGNNGFLELEGQTVSGVAAPTVGEARLFAGTDGKIYVRKAGSTQAEELGAGGSGEINLVDNSSDAGNWVGTNATVTTNTTAANNPLSGTIDSSIAVASSTSGGYAYYRFSMPAALKQRKLKLEWYQIAASLTSGDYRVEVYTNAASDYSGAYTELSLSTDSGGNSPIPNLNGKYSTTFDTTSADYYEIRVVRTAASAATLYIANVVCGPGIQPQGAVVGEWQSYTPTFGGFGTNYTSLRARYRRVGSQMEIYVFLQATAAVGGNITVSLPTGHTINTSAIQGDNADAESLGDAVMRTTSSPFGRYLARGYYNSSTSILFFTVGDSGVNNTWSATAPVTWASGDRFSARLTVPINEWAGSGTVQLAQNDVEYAYNTLTTNASDTTSFGYGSSGAVFPNITATGTTVNKRVRFQTNIQVGDKLDVEYQVNGSGPWFLAAPRFPYTSINNSLYGLVVSPVSGSTTDVDVVFSAQGASSYGAASYGAAGELWSGYSSGGWRWRVRKSSAGAAVGFGIVQPGTSAGLVSASGLPGNTTGNPIASGYVGEVVSANITTSTTLSTTQADITGASISLSTGVWEIKYSVSANYTTGATAGNTGYAIVSITDSSNTLVGNTGRIVYCKTVANISNTVYTSLVASTVQVVSAASATFKLRGIRVDTSGTGSASVETSAGFQSTFYAVRIA